MSESLPPTAPEATSGVRVFPPLLPLLGLAVGFLLEWWRAVPIAPEAARAATRWTGGALVAICFGLAGWAVATFRRLGTTPNPTRPTTALAERGPYRFTRNPMYLALLLGQTGVALLANALWPLATMPLVAWALDRLVIAREERYLEARYGDAYRALKARVPRWL